jgi:hypothetical protein
MIPAGCAYWSRFCRREGNRVFYRIASDDVAVQAITALLESLERSLTAQAGSAQS